MVDYTGWCNRADDIQYISHPYVAMGKQPSEELGRENIRHESVIDRKSYRMVSAGCFLFSILHYGIWVHIKIIDRLRDVYCYNTGMEASSTVEITTSSGPYPTPSTLR